MVLLSVSLKNFLSYGPGLQEIDFSPYSFICFVGQNGHGKSSIFDAVTWAIWGQARKTSGAVRPDDGLVHLGQSHMVVFVEFMLGVRKYKIRREYLKSQGKGQVTLDFSVFQEEHGNYVSLGGKSIRSTQAIIEQTIGIDFNTFVNSSFIRQGQSDEFSKKSPKDRKQIIGSILSLDFYDKIVAQAQEKNRLCLAEKKEYALLIDEISNELKEKDALSSELRSVCEKERELDKLLASLKEEIQEIQKNLLEDKVLEDRLKFGIEQLLKKVYEYEALKMQYIQKATMWRKQHATMIKSNMQQQLESRAKNLQVQGIAITAQYRDFLAAQQKCFFLRKQLDELKKHFVESSSAASSQISSKQQAIFLEEKQVEYQQEKLSQQIVTLEKENISSEKKLDALRADSIRLEGFLPRIHFCTKQVNRLKGIGARWTYLLGRLNEELEEFHGRKDLLKQCQKAICPLCQQSLNERLQVDLVEKYAQSILAKQRKKVILERALKEVKFVYACYQKELTSFAGVESERAMILANYDGLILKREQDLRASQELRSSLDSLVHASKMISEKKLLLEEERVLFEKTLHESFEACDEVKTISLSLNKQLKLFEGFAGIEEKYNAHLQAQEIFQRDYSVYEKMMEAKNIQQDFRRDIAKLFRTLQLSKVLYFELSATKKTLGEVSSKVQLHGDNLFSIEKVLSESVLQREEIVKRRSVLDAQRARFEQLSFKVGQLTMQLKKAAEEIEEYEYIIQACGKSGIQALLIEQILPEIEEEANKILDQLTENQMHIIIEPLKDLKSGGVKETLDIHISDRFGLRPYEMFSGGEAFRIDFALRIALSKLLSRRAGSPLEMLLIDEGFGSQDEEGMARLVEVLYAVHQDFRKILVITHLPDLKESFPVHFRVNKTPTGSVVFVEERS